MHKQSNQADTVDNPFRILTKREKARIASILIGHALAHECMASKSNAEIARELRVSKYAVRTHRSLMKKLGILGTIKGNSRPQLATTPDTTWERLRSALWYAEEVFIDAAEGFVNSPYVPSLQAACKAAEMLAEQISPDLRLVANAVDLIESLSDLCEE